MTDATDDIKKLVESYQGWTPDEVERYPWAASQAISDLLVKLEAEHQQAEEWRVLWEKAANGVLTLQAERDALRTAIQEGLDAYRRELGPQLAKHSGAVVILSRAIDTKEPELDEATMADIEQEERDHMYDMESDVLTHILDTEGY